MPKTIYLPEYKGYQSSGIDITYTPSRLGLYISGWFDSCVGIGGTELTLAEFFTLLGITEKDCKKAFKSMAAAVEASKRSF